VSLWSLFSAEADLLSELCLGECCIVGCDSTTVLLCLKLIYVSVVMNLMHCPHAALAHVIINTIAPSHIKYIKKEPVEDHRWYQKVKECTTSMP